jgi:hypothetical protein
MQTDGDMDADTSDTVTTPPAQTSPYFATTTDTSRRSPVDQTQNESVTDTLNQATGELGHVP